MAPTAPGPPVQPGTTRSTTTDKLRATFKCPKFLGEVRHWKVWNQGFVRFLSINKFDHVIEEDFLVGVLTLESLGSKPSNVAPPQEIWGT